MSKRMRTVGLITARGGSKGIPGKNGRNVAGKPLMAWTIEAALCSRRLCRVVVSTDDPGLARISRQCGADVPFIRPHELAQDDTPHIDVVRHAIQWLRQEEGFNPDSFMLLQPTIPLREASDIDASVQLLESNDAEAVVSVCEVNQHPYLMKEIDSDERLSSWWSGNGEYLRRQILPKLYVLNGAVYLQKCSSWMTAATSAPDGAVPYVMPPERSLDVDTPWDMQLADLILRNSYERHAA